MIKQTLPAPTPLDNRAAAVLFTFAATSSLAVRGSRRSLMLLAAAVLPAAIGETLAIRGLRNLRHHSRPQIGEVPVLLPFQWYSFIAPSYGLAEAAVGDRGPLAVAAATAILATATDVANDPWGLASGFWEWRDGGPFVPDVRGANGVAGIPLGNYVGWLLIAGSAAYMAERGRTPEEMVEARHWRSLLLILYLLLGMRGIAWAVSERRWSLTAAGIASVFGSGLAAWWAARPHS